jgi:hypothetical protein
MLEAWAGAVGVDTRTTLSTILKAADERASTGELCWPDLAAALSAAAFTITNHRGKPADAEILGKWLRGFKGRVVDGKRFENKSNPKGGSKWWIEIVGYEPPPGDEVETTAVAAPTPNRTIPTVF